jgi:hypothetical protein
VAYGPYVADRGLAGWSGAPRWLRCVNWSNGGRGGWQLPGASRPEVAARLSTCQGRHDVAVEWFWVASLDEVNERRQHARQLVGLQLAAVRYCEIDYARLDRLKAMRVLVR